MAIDPNVPAIANAITGAVDNWNSFISNQRDWSAGTATGGPANDGYYPLKNSLGVTYSLPSPAKLVALTTGPMSQAVAIQSDVANAKTLILSTANTVALNLTYVLSNAAAAAGSAATATAQATVATTQAGLALTYRNTTQAAMNSTVAANTIVASNLTLSNAVLTAVNATNSAVQQAKTDAGNYAAQATAQAATVNPTAIYGAISSNVATINGTLSTKAPIANPTFTADATVNGKFVSSSATATNGIHHYLTNGAADAKWSRSYAYANTLAFDFVNDAYSAAATWLTVGRTGYSPTAINFTGTALNFNGSAVATTNDLNGKLSVSQGLSTGYAAWSVNSLGIDSYQGEGQLNVMGGAVLAKTANASATGHVFLTTSRGASRLGLHDNVINMYVANTASGTAGQPVTWIQTASISSAAANFLVQPQFGGVNLATSTDLTNGLATKQAILGYTPANVAGATFTGAVAFNSTVTIGGNTPWTSGNFTPSTKLDTSAFTWSGLSGKPSTFAPSAHTHTTADVTGLDATLAAKAPLASPAFTGSANLTGAAATNRLWGVQTAGSQRWMFGTDAAGESGFNAGSNWALYSYADNGAYIGNPIFVNRASSAIALNGAVSTSGALSVTGNVNATGSMFVGAAGGLFVTGQNYRLVFDGSGGTRVNFRSDHATAAGLNLVTNDGTFRGAIYYDGSLGFLNQNNGWRFRTGDTYASIYSNAGIEYVLYGAHNFNPAGKMDVAGGTFTGQVSSNSNFRAVSTGGTGQFTAVSGSTMAGFYQDGTTFYILKNSTSNTTFDGHRPMYVNLSTGSVTLDGTGAGGTTIGGAAYFNGDMWGPQNGWFRVRGSGGVYFQDYGTGLYSLDTSWLRSYSDRGIYTGGTMLAGAMQAGTITATSDARFKTNIRPLEPVTGLVPTRFVKDGKESLGYIAQAVQATGAKEAVHDRFGVNGEHSLALDPLAMTAAVHAQLSAELAAAVARIEALEARP